MWEEQGAGEAQQAYSRSPGYRGCLGRVHSSFHHPPPLASFVSLIPRWMEPGGRGWLLGFSAQLVNILHSLLPSGPVLGTAFPPGPRDSPFCPNPLRERAEWLTASQPQRQGEVGAPAPGSV